MEEEFKKYNYFILSIVDNDQIILEASSFEISINISEEYLTKRELFKYKFLTNVINRYNRLCVRDKKIIYYTYMDKEKHNDDFIANKLGYNINYYYRIKREAIINVAYALNIEKYEGEVYEGSR